VSPRPHVQRLVHCFFRERRRRGVYLKEKSVHEQGDIFAHYEGVEFVEEESHVLASRARHRRILAVRAFRQNKSNVVPLSAQIIPIQSLVATEEHIDRKLVHAFCPCQSCVEDSCRQKVQTIFTQVIVRGKAHAVTHQMCMWRKQ